MRCFAASIGREGEKPLEGASSCTVGLTGQTPLHCHLNKHQDERRIAIHDVLGETKEQLEFRDPVVRMSLGYGHLAVATASQCHIYSTSNFNTPHIFDLQQPLQLLLQCERSLLLVDAAACMQVVTYEGRAVCNPKAAGMRPELLSAQMASLSPDTLAAMDRPGGGSVRLFDTAQGRQQGEPYAHCAEIRQVALSQVGGGASASDGSGKPLRPTGFEISTATPRASAFGSKTARQTQTQPTLHQAPSTAADRLLALVDRNRDLFLIHTAKRASVKLASSVDAAAWHDASPMLAAIVDGRLAVWYHPMVAFVDPGLLDATRSVRSDWWVLGV